MTSISAERAYLHLLPALVGAVLVLGATSVYGAGVDSDSVSYSSAAENLLSTGSMVTTFISGPAQTLTHFPPFYSVLLAPLNLTGADIEHSSAVLNASLFVLYIIAIQLLVFRATDGSTAAALLAGYFSALSTAVLFIYARVWSETVFLVLFLFGVLTLVGYLQDSRAGSLVAAGVLVALACLSRYVGVTIVAAGVFAILMWSPKPYALRARDGVIFGAIATAPMAMYLLYLYQRTGEVTDRALSYHPVPLSWWRDSVDTLSAWLIPTAVPYWAKAVAAIAVLAIAGLGLYLVVQENWRANAVEIRTTRPWIIPAVLLLFSAIYLGFFYVAVTFADSGRLSGRTLSPIYSSMVVVSAYGLHRIVLKSRATRSPLTAGVIVLLCSGLLGIQLMRSVMWATRTRVEGFEYSSRSWREAPAVDYLQTLPAETLLYSNRPQSVFFLVARTAYPIAYSHCRLDCMRIQLDMDAIPEAARSTAVIVWAHDQGNAECYECFLAAATEYGFVSVLKDDHFHLFAPANRQ